MKVYKLTSEDLKTRGGFQWEPGERREIPPEEREWELCGRGIFHAYRSAAMAVMMDPIHGDFGPEARLWEAETDAVVVDDDTKIGVHDLTLLHEVPLPRPTVEQRIAFAVLCADVRRQPYDWAEWAWGWLLGVDRSQAAEAAAREAAAREAAAAEAAAREAEDLPALAEVAMAWKETL